MDRDYLLAPPAPEESIDWAAVGVLALATAAEAAKLIVTPGGMTIALAERAKNLTLDDMKKWGSNLWESLSQPLVESADPHATPMPLDTVDCKKKAMRSPAVTLSRRVPKAS